MKALVSSGLIHCQFTSGLKVMSSKNEQYNAGLQRMSSRSLADHI